MNLGFGAMLELLAPDPMFTEAIIEDSFKKPSDWMII
jgi:hypothetical protein